MIAFEIIPVQDLHLAAGPAGDGLAAFCISADYLRHSEREAMKKNIALAIGSVLLVLVLSVVVDRVLGAFVAAPPLPDTMALIFPPHARQAYASTDFEYEVQINALGLRERELPAERGDEFVIAAIGDSFTYGWGVNAEDTWLRRLEAKLQDDGLNVRTVNCGKPGSGPETYVEHARAIIPVIRPDLVVVGVTIGNDISGAGPELTEQVTDSVVDQVRTLYPNIVQLIQDARRPPLEALEQQAPPQVSTAAQNRQWSGNTARGFLEKMTPEHRKIFDGFEPAVKHAFMSGNLNPYMIDLAMQNPEFYNLTLNLDDAWIQQCIERLAGRLSLIAKMAERNNAKMLVIAVPDGPYVNDDAHKNIQRVGYEVAPDMVDATAPEEAVRRAAEAAGLPFVGVMEGMKEHRADPDIFFELDGHLTAKGHQIFGDLLAPEVEAFIDGAAG